MIKKFFFLHNPFHVVVDVNNQLFQYERMSSWEEDDKKLQQVSLVSIGAENKVLVQSGAKIQERVKHARK